MKKKTKNPATAHPAFRQFCNQRFRDNFPNPSAKGAERKKPKIKIPAIEPQKESKSGEYKNNAAVSPVITHKDQNQKIFLSTTNCAAAVSRRRLKYQAH